MKLKALVETIAIVFKRETDIPFKRKIEEDIISTRALLIRRSYEKEGRFFDSCIQEFIVELTDIDESYDQFEVDKDLTKVSKTKIPRPIRVKSVEPYIYVGSDDFKTSAAYITLGVSKFYETEEDIDDELLYTVVGDKLYIFKGDLDKAGIRLVAADPREIAILNHTSANPLHLDVEIEEDLVPLIKDIIYRELQPKDVGEDHMVNINK